MNSRYRLPFCAAACVLLAAQFVTVSSAAQQLYRITDLSDLPGNFGARALALNESAQVVGISVSSPQNEPFIWDAVNGIQSLGAFPGAQGANATDINEAGLVSGWTVGGLNTSFVWTGAYVDIGVAPGFSESQAVAINNANQVVGLMFSGPSAFLWDDDGAPIAQLTDPLGGVVLRFATDINDAGTIVGGSGNDEAFVMLPGTAAQELGLLDAGDVSSAALGVNAANQVVGESRSGPAAARGFFWQAGGPMIDVGSTDPAHDLITAAAINEAGQVVGTSAGTFSADAFIWTQMDGIQDLNDLIDPADPLVATAVLQSAHDINNAGQIVVDGTINFAPRAFLLTPVGDPDPPDRVVFDFSGPLIAAEDYTTTGTYADSAVDDVMTGRFILGATATGSSETAPGVYEFPSASFYGNISDGTALTSTQGSVRNLEVSFNNNLSADADAIDFINAILGTSLPEGTPFDELQIETDIINGTRRLEIGVNFVSLDLGFITDTSYQPLPDLNEVDFAVYFIIEEDGPTDLYDAVGLIASQTVIADDQDTDGDGIADFADNCTLVSNGPDTPGIGANSQRDSNGDGYGNLCDPDLNNDGIVNTIDLGLFKLVFFSADADADFNGDGVVNALDLGILKAMFFLPPGPSGVAP